MGTAEVRAAYPPLMDIISAAILAVHLSVILLPGENGVQTPDPPVGVRFRLPDGATVAGKVTAWDEEGVEGAFGRHRWSDMEAAQAWIVLRPLAERGGVSAWILAGEILLGLKDGAPLAERAFKEALRRDPSSQAQIDEARDRSAAASGRRAAAAAAQSAQFRTDSPESRPWPSTPWPTLTPDERLAAEQTMKEDALAVIPDADGVIQVRSDDLLVRGMIDAMDAAQLATTLEKNVGLLAQALGIDPKSLPFWGPAVVLVAKDREHYRLIQELAFGQAPAPDEIAMCHCVGPKVFVILQGDINPAVLIPAAARELAHGLLHRHISPVRLPAWANEGLAEWAAGQLRPEPADLVRRREIVQAAMRSGVPIAPVFDQGYGSPPWENGNMPAAAIGRLAIELMLAERVQGFREWVRQVKHGTPWPEALGTAFGTPPRTFVDAVWRHYQTND